MAPRRRRPPPRVRHSGAGADLPAYDAAREAGASAADAASLGRAVRASVQEATLTSSDSPSRDNFGYSVSLSGARALVGAPGDDDAGSKSGSAYVFVRAGSTWTQEDSSSQTMPHQATTSATRCRSMVTAPSSAPTETTTQALTAVRRTVFVRAGGTWTQEGKLVAADAAGSDFFGKSVSLDGDRALVGAWGDDIGSTISDTNSGAAYVFVRAGSAWTQEDKLVATDAAGSDFFGYSVSLDGDRRPRRRLPRRRRRL